ncbi:DUF647-domain-containing protein [Agrocybe pediades]|nr:DUF647-domain-containing protein [Agrocybe pediades]
MFVVEERNERGKTVRTCLEGSTIKSTQIDRTSNELTRRVYAMDFLSKVFLPSGYPNSVSPDYLHYQVLNALQAFCNSLAGLLSSRAILQGFGVGNPNASATKALLLTVLQDVFGRLTTILSAHFFGSSLYPEAKTYRLLADVLNDIAVVLDTLSPLFIAVPIPGLRVASLCLSAIFKSLCGISAGGSKAALTMHFATPLQGKGDVGDLNAKDASKETVLALFGMLLGTLIVPYLTTSWATYSALFILVGLHLGINYLGVRGLHLRTLNRQRASIAWLLYRDSKHKDLTPSTVAGLERIFDRPGYIRDLHSHRPIGQCTIGSSFSKFIRPHPCPTEIIDFFSKERYILWFDGNCLSSPRSLRQQGLVRLHIFLKEKYTNEDQFRAWIHAVEVCKDVASGRGDTGSDGDLDALRTIQNAFEKVSVLQKDFLRVLESAHWITSESMILNGAPDSIITLVDKTGNRETKKTR